MQIKQTEKEIQYQIPPQKKRDLGLKDVKLFAGPFKNWWYNLGHTLKRDVFGRTWDRIWRGRDRLSHWSFDYYFLDLYEDILRWLFNNRYGSPPIDCDYKCSDDIQCKDCHEEWDKELAEQIKKVARLREEQEEIFGSDLKLQFDEIIDWFKGNIQKLWD